MLFDLYLLEKEEEIEEYKEEKHDENSSEIREDELIQTHNQRVVTDGEEKKKKKRGEGERSSGLENEMMTEETIDIEEKKEVFRWKENEENEEEEEVVESK